MFILSQRNHQMKGSVSTEMAGFIVKLITLIPLEITVAPTGLCRTRPSHPLTPPE
jgi:hypothetical protein